jgi:molybdopterin/thiamine biosynthesis adenylyltransferase
MFADTLQEVLKDEIETCAVFFIRAGTSHSSPDRYFATRVTFPSATAYRERTRLSATLSPEYVVQLTNEARAEGLGLVFVHTHPFATGVPSFSSIDDNGEKELSRFLRGRLSQVNHLALVVGPGGVKCRVLGEAAAVEVIEVGPRLVTHSRFDDAGVIVDTFERQVRALGVEGQRAIRRLRIAVVGLGGTGSLVAQQLAYLGVSNLVFVDPDRIETHNLNRLVGATPADVGSAKVAIAERHVKFINPDVRVLGLVRDVVDDDVAASLADTDFVFCCTDSHASRAVLNQLAYQYLVPCIDMGVGIALSHGEIASVTARVQMLAPGLPCLTCTNAIDASAVRQELMTPEQRRADPYFTGGSGVPQPAVITLNSTVASLATTMFIGAVTSAPFESRFQIYDGLAGTVRSVVATREPRCIVCSAAGSLARGVSWPLPTRPAGSRTSERQ